MIKIEEDISKLTTIPLQEVQFIINFMSDCICYNLQESVKNKEENIDIDIGIGTLVLDIDNDELKYKFIPSNKLENDIKYTLINGHCPLIDKAEECLQAKILGAYKELF